MIVVDKPLKDIIKWKAKDVNVFTNTDKKNIASIFLTTFQASPSMLLSLQPRACSFLARIIGGDSQTLHRPITSPYTSRTLKPFIRKDYESRPLKLQLLQEIVAFHHRYHFENIYFISIVRNVDSWKDFSFSVLK